MIKRQVILMEIRHLQYFMEVTRTGSFTQAASQLYITQPAISRVIKSLEEEVGAPLFHRSRKQLTLTAAGRVLYKRAQTIEVQYQKLQTELDELRHLKKGHIRIGLPSIVNSFFFSRLMASFHKEYPEVTFQLEEDGSKRVEENVMNDKLDFGVVVLPTQRDVFDYYAFVKEKLKLVVPASHYLANQQSISLPTLKEEAFIMFDKDFALRDSIMTACKQAGFEPSIISETSQLDFIEEMVASNLGVSLLPESTCHELTSNVQAISVHPAIDWVLAIIWKRDHHLTHMKKEFIRFAKEKLS
jgi:DNA-binding transcriptional LysR family regulator